MPSYQWAKVEAAKKDFERRKKARLEKEKAMTKDKNENGLTFDEWMAQVDVYMMGQVGVGHRDIADYLYYDAWSDGVDPAEAGQDALENDDLYAFFF